MKTLLFGSKGQLGADIVDVWDDNLKAFAHDDVDVSKRDAVHEVVSREQPDLIINAAAFTRVDDCETNYDAAYDVNALPKPLNIYGVSKLAGEHFVRQSNPKHYIVRTSSLFGVHAQSNFVEAVIRKAKAGEPLRVVDNQVSSPTLSYDLARKLQELAATDAFGLFHVTNSGSTSWYGLAAKAFELMGLEPSLTAIKSEELALPATRPAFSVLENRALVEAGLTKLRPWEQAIEAYLLAKGHTQA
jgi:dTDP-4-dehydrorhamnose reductase